MAIVEKFKELFHKPIVVQTQLVLGYLATGLAVSWLILFGLEISRSGIVSLYLDLNLILVLALGAWLLSILGKNNN